MGLLCPVSHMKNLFKSQRKKALLGKKRPSMRELLPTRQSSAPGGLTPVTFRFVQE